KSKWPRTVRPISWGETDGLGIDVEGRLHWNGKPVEIRSQRLDLTKGQAFVAILVMIFTGMGALGAMLQGWPAYHDWACKTGWPTIVQCPQPPPAAVPPAPQ